MGMGALFFMLLLNVGLRAAGYGFRMPKAGLMQTGVGLLILLCASSFVFLVFQLAGNGTAAVLLLFFLSVVMQYLSGGFLPSVFLPETVQIIGRFVPTAYLIKAAGSLYAGGFSGETAWLLLFFTVVFGSVSYGIGRLRMMKEV